LHVRQPVHSAGTMMTCKGERMLLFFVRRRARPRRIGGSLHTNTTSRGQQCSI